MEFIKHECGIAMVRLLKDRKHYEERYGDSYYGLHLFENMLIRQYNRGQDGAGMGVVETSEPKRDGGIRNPTGGNTGGREDVSQNR